MNLDEYIDRFRPLSLTARVTIELLALERYCCDRGLRLPEIDDAIEYLWRWADGQRRGDFSEWEQSRPDLVMAAFERKLTPTVLAAIPGTGTTQRHLETMLSVVCGTLWGNFWAGAEDEPTLMAFREFFESCRDMWRPPLMPFKHSLFANGDGWCHPDAEDIEYWRSMRVYA